MLRRPVRSAADHRRARCQAAPPATSARLNSGAGRRAARRTRSANSAVAGVSQACADEGPRLSQTKYESEGALAQLWLRRGARTAGDSASWKKSWKRGPAGSQVRGGRPAALHRRPHARPSARAWRRACGLLPSRSSAREPHHATCMVRLARPRGALRLCYRVRRRSGACPCGGRAQGSACGTLVRVPSVRLNRVDDGVHRAVILTSDQAVWLHASCVTSTTARQELSGSAGPRSALNCMASSERAPRRERRSARQRASLASARARAPVS